MLVTFPTKNGLEPYKDLVPTLICFVEPTSFATSCWIILPNAILGSDFYGRNYYLRDDALTERSFAHDQKQHVIRLAHLSLS